MLEGDNSIEIVNEKLRLNLNRSRINFASVYLNSEIPFTSVPTLNTIANPHEILPPPNLPIGKVFDSKTL